MGDRIRMNSISSPRAYMRSLATRESDKALSEYVQEAIDICKAADYDLVILESAGVGQSDASILDYVNVSMYVMTPEYGAASQLEKINMLDYADVVCVNKFDKAGALDALHDVRKQFKRNHGLWTAQDEELPVIGTIAAQFNDAGVNELFERLMEKIAAKCGVKFHGEIEHHAHTGYGQHHQYHSSQTGTLPGRDRGEQRGIQYVGDRAGCHCHQTLPAGWHTGYGRYPIGIREGRTGEAAEEPG